MTEPVRKRRPKVNQNSLVKEKPEGPVCPIHHLAMAYEPSDLAWLCPDSACEQIKIPKPEFSSNGVPVPGKGPIELVVYTEQDGLSAHMTYLLRATGNNVVLDITPWVRDAECEMVSPIGQTVNVQLTLTQMTVMEGPPNAKKKKQ